jgi:glucose-6-phosphate 1-dehydrogenase
MMSMAKGYLFDVIKPPTLAEAVVGQYSTYQAHVEQDRSKWMKEPEDISKRSNTPTFASVRLSVASERWEGVPIYVTSGKAMEEREACVFFSSFLFFFFFFS